MPKNKVIFCKNCGRNTECLYKGKKGKRDPIIPIGVINTITQILDDDRPKFWQCTKCGEIFEED